MHFAPRRNWINDPNGLVFHNGRYHLFFQYNPDGIHHDEISWGHASSTDLVTWDEHPVALRANPDTQIYSGSAVVDHANTSGFGTGSEPAMVACYTAHSRVLPHQTQALAYSTDEGQTWEYYDGNPVLDRDSSDFRDPKLFWYDGDAGSYWVMVAVEAREHQVVLYRSDDLRTWDYLSSYGPHGAVGGVWECPDLFPLTVDGNPHEERWVLVISLSPGGVAGGSGTTYVIGSFDGIRFTPDQPWTGPNLGADAPREDLERHDWLDHGRDCYAGVTFFGLPQEERILIAWMSNWDYAHHMPYDEAAPQRGRMALPRRLSLVRRAGRIQLAQEAVGRADRLVAELDDDRLVTDLGHERLAMDLPEECRIELTVTLDDATGFSLALGSDRETAVVLSYDAQERRVSMDRTQVAGEDLPASFRGVASMPVEGGSEVTWTLWIGPASIELFTDGGTRALTNLTGAQAGPSVWFEPREGSARIRRLSVFTSE